MRSASGGMYRVPGHLVDRFSTEERERLEEVSTGHILYLKRGLVRGRETTEPVRARGP